VGLPTTCFLMGYASAMYRQGGRPLHRRLSKSAWDPLFRARPPVSGLSMRDSGYPRSTDSQHRVYDTSGRHGLGVSVERVWRELGSIDELVQDDLQHGGAYDLCSHWGALFMPVSPCWIPGANSCPKLGNQDGQGKRWVLIWQIVPCLQRDTLGCCHFPPPLREGIGVNVAGRGRSAHYPPADDRPGRQSPPAGWRVRHSLADSQVHPNQGEDR
jgi:hypothetical protein